jgi:hypothetical protein
MVTSFYPKYLCWLGFHHYDKYFRETIWKEERSILAQGFRGFSSWLAGATALGLRQGRISWLLEHVTEAAHLMVAREQRKRKCLC